MHLTWIALGDFRSYPSLEWRPVPGVNLLVGENGAGKTNLLEAIGYLASLRSFRGAPDEAMVGFDAGSAVVRGEVVDADATALIEIELRRRGGKRALVNRQRLPRSADLLGHVRMVAFLPEDLDLVKRGPSHRRAMLDDLAVQLWPGSHLDQAEYDRAVRQRNAFLKQGADDPVTLGVWDERLAQAGGKVMVRRSRALEAVSSHLAEAHEEIAGVDVEVGVSYGSEWGGTLDPSVSAGEHADTLARALEGRRRVDRERRITTVGPHRDDPVLLIGGHDARHHASQGEQRTLALAIRLASHRAIRDVAGIRALLLLDDVYSELDPGRSAALTRALPEAQTFVTTAHPAEVPLVGWSWEVVEGAVRA
jgi:DNA replication and repair protein RecF